MPSDPRSAFLLVRRIADLQHASEELTAYLSILCRRFPGKDPGVILGIWIDEDGVANLPSTLVLPHLGGARRTVRILETTGINGIWMLCWLEALDCSVSRSDLVAALLEYLGREEAEAAMLGGRFLPVFMGDAVTPSAGDELRALKLCYPGLVLSPAYLGRDGTLCLPPAQMDINGAAMRP